MSEPNGMCYLCGADTGREDDAADSLWDDFDWGPYCDDCWNARFTKTGARRDSEAEARHGKR